jgi:hypothetical protein
VIETTRRYTPAATARIVANSGPAMRRASSLLLLTVGFFLLSQAAEASEVPESSRLAGVSGGGWGEPGCGAFSLTQTYENWGPARHYGVPVTVAYDATRCSRDRGDVVVLTIEGVAVVHRGNSTEGAVLDERPFYVSGRLAGTSNAEGWPPDWWGCQVEAADYTWRIAGVYTFAVSAREGQWQLFVSVDDREVHWAYDGCA